MGACFAMSPCICCGATFTYNPVAVPSTTFNGRREPICQHCFDLINAKRAEKGLPPFPLAPKAYGACEDTEL